jgi:hypothetical protein
LNTRQLFCPVLLVSGPVAVTAIGCRMQQARERQGFRFADEAQGLILEAGEEGALAKAQRPSLRGPLPAAGLLISSASDSINVLAQSTHAWPLSSFASLREPFFRREQELSVRRDFGKEAGGEQATACCKPRWHLGWRGWGRIPEFRRRAAFRRKHATFLQITLARPRGLLYTSRPFRALVSVTLIALAAPVSNPVASTTG